MVVGKETLVEVLDGGLRELPVAELPNPDPQGRVLPLQASATSRAICYIRVNEVVAIESAGWLLLFDRVPQPDRPRFLAADSTRGYTSDPGRALKGEPEPVPEVWQELICEEADAKADHAWQKIEVKLARLPFTIRLRLCVEVAAFRGVRIREDVYQIGRKKNRGRAMGMLKQLERRVHRR